MKKSHPSYKAIAAFIFFLEVVFSFFLYLSLAERVFVITPAGATAGIPELISYQGMLTDSSGNALGGAGSTYCFRYSIWDSVSAGNQLWPSGTPSNSTTTVTDGVFSDQLGRMDNLSGLDFMSTSTYYLQVQVSTSSLTCATGLETLAPRQQIVSDAWSETSQGVYGSQLQTNSTANKVQIGTGAGVTYGSQTLLSLDWVSNSGGETIGSTTCSTENGSLWYDSSLNRTVVCENGIVEPVSLHTGTPFYVPYWNASGTLLAATSSLFISSSTGYVGVGTSSPATILDVNGNITDRGLVSQNCVGTNAAGTLITGTCLGGSSGIASINNGTGTYSITAGTNITISTTSNSTIINSAGSSGGSSVGTTGTLQVASSTAGQFAAYGGSTACGNGNAVTTISTAGGTTCASFVSSITGTGISGSLSTSTGVFTITLGAITPSSIVDSGTLNVTGTATFTGNIVGTPTSSFAYWSPTGILTTTSTPSSGGLASYNVTSANSFISVSTTTTSAALTFSSSSLGLGTAAYTASSAYLAVGGTAANSTQLNGQAASYYQTALGFTPAHSGANSDITSLTGLTTPLGATYGGTGQSAVTTGDLLYGSGTNTWSRLAASSTGNALLSNGVGVAPSWGDISLTNTVTGILPFANGGTATTTALGSNAFNSTTIPTSYVSSTVAGTGIGVSGATGAVTITNQGVQSLTGTANQISLTTATGTPSIGATNPFVDAGIQATTITATTSVVSPTIYATTFNATTSIVDAGTLSVTGISTLGKLGFSTGSPTISRGSVTGSDNGGLITFTTAGTTTTLTFVPTWTSTPVCVVSIASGTPIAIGGKAAAATLLITAASSMPANDTVAYMCQGNPN